MSAHPQDLHSFPTRRSSDLPCRMPSTRWSRLPTPPEAITGTGTLSATARVNGISKPCRVPSRSIEVSRRSEEHTSELQSRLHLVCRLLLEKKKPTSANLTLR